MLEKIKDQKVLIKKYVILFLIAACLEIFLFNISSYSTLLGKHEVKICDEPEFLYYSEDGNRAFVIFDDIDIKTETVKVDIDNIEKITEYKIFYSDETTSSHIGGFVKKCIPGNEKSKFIHLNLSGITKSIIVELDSSVYNSENLKSLSVNEKIPFEFNKTRFLVVFLIISFAYFMKTSSFFKQEYSNKNFKQELVLLGILAIFLFILSYINTYSVNENEFEFYSKNFVDALANGSIALLEEPSDEFKNLENPYDAQERASLDREKDYIWDTAYYNGKQYVYFGILPMLISFLPYYFITKKYLKMSIVIFVFSALCFILLKEILLKLLSKFFEKIPFNMVIYFLVTLCSGSLILYANGIPRIYELAIVSALYFVLQGIYFIMNALENEKKRYRNIFFGCLFLALAVACRPTSLFVSLLILPYLIYLLIESIKIFKENKLPLVKLLISTCIPYLTIGALLMWYNYIRFGNVFDFGTKYQLTIINMNSLSNRFSALPVGLITNLFSIPEFLSEFPFITYHNKLTTFYGYYYIENMIGGLCIIVPIVFMNFWVLKANKDTQNRSLKILLNSLVIVGSLLCILSVMIGGSNQRYLIDYAWILILSAILIFCIFYNKLQSEEAKKILQKILCYITIYTFIISISAGIVSEKDYMKKYSPEKYYELRYTVCFWE